MNCKHIRPLLSAYLDGELDPAQQAKVDSHLAACQECVRTLEDFRSLGEGIRALPNVAVPTAVETGLRARLHRKWILPLFDTRVLARGVSSVLFVAFVVALVFGLSALFERTQPASRTAEVVATYPPDGATDVPLDANLALTFARPMDRASVEAATDITPETQLAFAWQEETLTLVPIADWQPATRYTLTVASTARETSGIPLGEPFELHFETVPTEQPPTGMLNPIGRFGVVWRAELGGPEGSLGYATAAEQELWCAVQRFEGGLMVWLDELQEDHIYVLTYGADESNGTWQRYVDTWREGDPENANLTPPEGLFEPIRGFGRLWREELGGSDAEIGWALAPEQGYVGTMQPFEHGAMLWNPLDGVVYVLRDDATWTAYPATQ